MTNLNGTGAEIGTYTLLGTGTGIIGALPTLNLPLGMAGTLAIVSNELQFTVTAVPVVDYGTWTSAFGLQNPWLGVDPALNGESAADPDRDGLSNQQEYAFGLNPVSGSSVAPTTVPLDKTTGQFSYTRRLPSLTSLGYSYQYSSTLSGAWNTSSPSATSSDSGSPTETITVTAPASILSANPKLFVRVVAQ